MNDSLYYFAEEANQRLDELRGEYNRLLQKYEHIQSRFDDLIKKYNDLNSRYAAVARALHRSLAVQTNVSASREDSHAHP